MEAATVSPPTRPPSQDVAKELPHVELHHQPEAYRSAPSIHHDSHEAPQRETDAGATGGTIRWRSLPVLTRGILPDLWGHRKAGAEPTIKQRALTAASRASTPSAWRGSEHAVAFVSPPTPPAVVVKAPVPFVVSTGTAYRSLPSLPLGLGDSSAKIPKAKSDLLRREGVTKRASNDERSERLRQLDAPLHQEASSTSAAFLNDPAREEKPHRRHRAAKKLQPKKHVALLATRSFEIVDAPARHPDFLPRPSKSMNVLHHHRKKHASTNALQPLDVQKRSNGQMAAAKVSRPPAAEAPSRLNKASSLEEFLVPDHVSPKQSPSPRRGTPPKETGQANDPLSPTSPSTRVTTALKAAKIPLPNDSPDIEEAGIIPDDPPNVEGSTVDPSSPAYDHPILEEEERTLDTSMNTENVKEDEFFDRPASATLDVDAVHDDHGSILALENAASPINDDAMCEDVESGRQEASDATGERIKSKIVQSMRRAENKNALQRSESSMEGAKQADESKVQVKALLRSLWRESREIRHLSLRGVTEAVHAAPQPLSLVDVDRLLLPPHRSRQPLPGINTTTTRRQIWCVPGDSEASEWKTSPTRDLFLPPPAPSPARAIPEVEARTEAAAIVPTAPQEEPPAPMPLVETASAASGPRRRTPGGGLAVPSSTKAGANPAATLAPRRALSALRRDLKTPAPPRAFPHAKPLRAPPAPAEPRASKPQEVINNLLVAPRPDPPPARRVRFALDPPVEGVERPVQRIVPPKEPPRDLVGLSGARPSLVLRRRSRRYRRLVTLRKEGKKVPESLVWRERARVDYNFYHIAVGENRGVLLPSSVTLARGPPNVVIAGNVEGGGEPEPDRHPPPPPALIRHLRPRVATPDPRPPSHAHPAPPRHEVPLRPDQRPPRPKPLSIDEALAPGRRRLGFNLVEARALLDPHPGTLRLRARPQRLAELELQWSGRGEDVYKDRRDWERVRRQSTRAALGWRVGVEAGASMRQLGGSNGLADDPSRRVGDVVGSQVLGSQLWRGAEKDAGDEKEAEKEVVGAEEEGWTQDAVTALAVEDPEDEEGWADIVGDDSDEEEPASGLLARARSPEWVKREVEEGEEAEVRKVRKRGNALDLLVSPETTHVGALEQLVGQRRVTFKAEARERRNEEGRDDVITPRTPKRGPRPKVWEKLGLLKKEVPVNRKAILAAAAEAAKAARVKARRKRRAKRRVVREVDEERVVEAALGDGEGVLAEEEASRAEREREEAEREAEQARLREEEEEALRRRQSVMFL